MENPKISLKISDESWFLNNRVTVRDLKKREVG